MSFNVISASQLNQSIVLLIKDEFLSIDFKFKNRSQWSILKVHIYHHKNSGRKIKKSVLSFDKYLKPEVTLDIFNEFQAFVSFHIMIFKSLQKALPKAITKFFKVTFLWISL